MRHADLGDSADGAVAFLTDLSARDHTPEALDDLSVEGPDLDRVLRELAWINRWSGATRRVLAAVQKVAGPRPHVVDLGCGAGDLLGALKGELPGARLTGIDGNGAVLRHAASRVSGAEWVQADILDPGFVTPPCDVVVSTHFLYRLSDEALRGFVARQPAKRWVIGELRRSSWAYGGFGGMGPLALSQWTVDDGQRALRRSWTPNELRAALGSGFELRVGLLHMVAVGGVP